MNYFQQLAAKYDAWFQTVHGQYVYRHEQQMIWSLTDLSAGMQVADIGCGTGIYTRELCQRGASVVGVDISAEMLAIAAEKNKDFTNQVKFIEADAAALPFKDNSFDLVFSITAMEFFEQPKVCLHEMYRIVRPGGHIIIATLNSLSLWSLQRRIKTWFKPTIFTHTKFYSINDIRHMIAPIPVTAWRGGIFIPPFLPEYILTYADTIEQWGQKWLPAFGTFIVVRLDKPNV